jgi:hypothetical protein
MCEHAIVWITFRRTLLAGASQPRLERTVRGSPGHMLSTSPSLGQLGQVYTHSRVSLQ